jgi:hypothetical protein
LEEYKSSLGCRFSYLCCDGPIPIGEVVGAAIVTGAVAYDLANQKGAQYTLRARTSGLYPNYKWGFPFPIGPPVHLNAGDVWKIGETMQYNAETDRQWRYSQPELDGWNVDFKAEFIGNKVQIMVMEGIKLINYVNDHGDLPLGNKGFK